MQKLIMHTEEMSSRINKSNNVLFFFLILFHIPPLFLMIWKNNPWLTGDSNRYLALSEALRNNQGYGLDNIGGFESEGVRMPGYPLLIAVCKIVGADSNFSIILLQAVLYCISVWLVWRITVKLFGQMSGFIFLCLSSVYPFVMYSVGQISPEISTVFLLSLAVYLLLEKSNWRIILATASLGVSAYFRPNLIFLSVFLFLSIVIADRRSWRKSLLVVGTAILVASPWVIRNYLVFERLTPITVIRGTGNSLMLAFWSSRVSQRSLINYGMKGEVDEELKQSGMIERISEINRQIGVPEETFFAALEPYPTNETKIKADKLLGEAALQNISENPLAFIKLMLLNSVRMWFSSNFPDAYPVGLKVILLVEGILVALLGLLGLLKALMNNISENNFLLILLCGMLSYFIITLSWSHTEARYTISIRLFVIMFASYAVHEIYKLTKNRFF